MPNPLVSIIIPVYNRPLEFERALHSAFAQDYPNIEIIVVDDGSVEDIKSVVDKNKEKSPFPLTYYRQENKGVGGARRRGLGLAKGKYIQHLDADEIILPIKISKQVSILEKNDDAVVCICGNTSGLYPEDLLELALNLNPYPTSSPLWNYPDNLKVDWLELIGGQDVVHDVNIGMTHRKVVWLQEELVIRPPSPGSHTNQTKKGAKRILRLRDNMQYPIIMYEMIKDAGLIKEKKYSEQISERLFRIAYQFAMVGEGKSARNLLSYSFRATQTHLKRLEIIMAYLLQTLTFYKTPILYEGLFRFHRLINPKSLHGDKNIKPLI